jgi:hypothetical protein
MVINLAKCMIIDLRDDIAAAAMATNEAFPAARHPRPTATRFEREWRA